MFLGIKPVYQPISLQATHCFITRTWFIHSMQKFNQFFQSPRSALPLYTLENYCTEREVTSFPPRHFYRTKGCNYSIFVPILILNQLQFVPLSTFYQSLNNFHARFQTKYILLFKSDHIQGLFLSSEAP